MDHLVADLVVDLEDFLEVRGEPQLLLWPEAAEDEVKYSHL